MKSFILGNTNPEVLDTQLNSKEGATRMEKYRNLVKKVMHSVAFARPIPNIKFICRKITNIFKNRAIESTFKTYRQQAKLFTNRLKGLKLFMNKIDNLSTKLAFNKIV